MTGAVQIPSVLVDAVQSIGVHNGVARLVLVRLNADGTSAPVIELLVPVAQVDSLVNGLGKVRGR